MVEDDTFTYHVKQLRRDPANTAVQSLITKERTQKLDLLIHLLSNLTQSLVVCGPEGIGKTTLLNVLQERKTESWRYCLMQGNADLSFEAILEQLAKAQSGRSSSAAVARQEGQPKQIGRIGSLPIGALSPSLAVGRTGSLPIGALSPSLAVGRTGSLPVATLPPSLAVVLIIDNAGELVPGLIAAIIQYAAANPDLRVIFALTHDELQVKRGSDRAVDDCHIVEIPPLSERQCGDFLQHLSTKPSLNLPFKAIGENMIEHIYWETHGVPGRIIAEVSGLSGAKQGGKLKWKLVLAVAVAIAIAVGVQWLTSSAVAPGPDLTSMDGSRIGSRPIATLPPSLAVGNAARLPGAVAAMQSAKNKDKDVTGIASVEQKAGNIGVVPPRTESQIMLSLPPARDDVSGASSAAGRMQEVEPRMQSLPKESMQPTVQSVIRQQEPSVPVKASAPHLGPVGNERNNQQAAPFAVESEAVIKQPEEPSVNAQQKVTEPIFDKQDKTKQAELTKAQSEPVSAVDQKSNNKQSDVAQLWAKQEKLKLKLKLKLKQAELIKSVNSAEPFVPNKLETIQLPQRPVDVAAVLGGQDVETLVPQQVEPEASLAQTANNFTLQLMVLSKQSSVNDVLKKYPAMSSGFRATNMIVNGQPRFVLEYGSYADVASANKARQSLPFEFRNALVRKMSSTKHR